MRSQGLPLLRTRQRRPSHLHLAETMGPLAVGAEAVRCWSAATAVWLRPVLLGIGNPYESSIC